LVPHYDDATGPFVARLFEKRERVRARSSMTLMNVTKEAGSDRQ
jgi:hypothetical protein